MFTEKWSLHKSFIISHYGVFLIAVYKYICKYKFKKCFYKIFLKNTLPENKRFFVYTRKLDKSKSKRKTTHSANNKQYTYYFCFSESITKKTGSVHKRTTRCLIIFCEWFFIAGGGGFPAVTINTCFLVVDAC